MRSEQGRALGYNNGEGGKKRGIQKGGRENKTRRKTNSLGRRIHHKSTAGVAEGSPCSSLLEYQNQEKWIYYLAGERPAFSISRGRRRKVA